MKGQLTIINLRECDKNLVSNRNVLRNFCLELCNVIKMKAYKTPIIKKFGKGKLLGYSAVQLIETSSIVVHLDEFENKAFIDIFSCKKFDSKKALGFSKKFFKSNKYSFKTIIRK
jgi:S-adenosylmethionine/arginine decarboxylase-like enzyme